MKRILSILLCGTALAVHAETKRPQISAPVLCGVVTTTSTKPVVNAEVAAMWADFGTSQQTDAQGRWSFGPHAGPHWMQIQADGFEPFIFDYVETGNEKDSGADKPAFIRTPEGLSCKQSIHVWLAPQGSKNGFVTVDVQEQKGK